MTRTLEEVMAKLTPERRARIEARAAEQLSEVNNHTDTDILYNLIDAVATIDEIAAIEDAFPPRDVRPQFDIPRFWSNTKLQDPETIIALVLTKPTSGDLERTIIAYGLTRVLTVLKRLVDHGELYSIAVTHVLTILQPIIKKMADRSR